MREERAHDDLFRGMQLARVPLGNSSYLRRTVHPSFTVSGRCGPSQNIEYAFADSLADIEINRVLASGARCCRLKNVPASELLQSIRQVHAGKKRIPTEIAALLAEHYSDTMLPGREVERLNYLLGGNRNRDIAEQWFIAVETVKVHIKHILAKLGATYRTHAAAIGLRRAVIQL